VDLCTIPHWATKSSINVPRTLIGHSYTLCIVEVLTCDKEYMYEPVDIGLSDKSGPRDLVVIFLMSDDEACSHQGERLDEARGEYIC
jgi:hypothetical protein